MITLAALLRYGIKRDFWGHQSLTPEWWPEGVVFVSPNERRVVGELHFG